jgi:hypothetical protein
MKTTRKFVENARVRYTVDGVVHTGTILVVDRDPLAYVWVTTDLNPDKSFTLPRCALEVLS